MLKVTNNAIQITRGDTGAFTVSITDAHGEPYILQDGDSVDFTVRRRPESSAIIRKKGPEIWIEPEDTSDLDFGEYVYDVQLTRGDGIVDTIIPPAKFEILPEVTY